MTDEPDVDEEPIARCVLHGLWIRQRDGRVQRIDGWRPGDPVSVRYHCGPGTRHIEGEP